MFIYVLRIFLFKTMHFHFCSTNQFFPNLTIYDTELLTLSKDATPTISSGKNTKLLNT